jgi:hypothetical protein
LTWSENIWSRIIIRAFRECKYCHKKNHYVFSMRFIDDNCRERKRATDFEKERNYPSNSMQPIGSTGKDLTLSNPIIRSNRTRKELGLKKNRYWPEIRKKKSGKDTIGKNSVTRFNSLFNKEIFTIKKRNHLI